MEYFRKQATLTGLLGEKPREKPNSLTYHHDSHKQKGNILSLELETEEEREKEKVTHGRSVPKYLRRKDQNPIKNFL